MMLRLSTASHESGYPIFLDSGFFFDWIGPCRLKRFGVQAAPFFWRHILELGARGWFWLLHCRFPTNRSVKSISDARGFDYVLRSALIVPHASMSKIYYPILTRYTPRDVALFCVPTLCRWLWGLRCEFLRVSFSSSLSSAIRPFGPQQGISDTLFDVFSHPASGARFSEQFDLCQRKFSTSLSRTNFFSGFCATRAPNPRCTFTAVCQIIAERMTGVVRSYEAALCRVSIISIWRFIDYRQIKSVLSVFFNSALERAFAPPSNGSMDVRSPATFECELSHADVLAARGHARYKIYDMHGQAFILCMTRCLCSLITNAGIASLRGDARMLNG